ncbi:S8 family serine peptidase [Dactylosporangium sp. NPDC050688]|uniref:S8 family serine peptidase n=1 Tax=Dactylosporangium sp. NPDC050688 TaxID=3157217 RepID=UPI0034037D67
MQAWTKRRSTGVVLILAAVWLLVAAGLPALAAPPSGSARVKYYLVAAGANGAVETVPEIALNLLGSQNRAGEIYELNVGRRQPDGGALTSGGSLRVGWALVLPWDAVGDGVRYGVLPGPASPPPATKAPTPTAKPNQSPPAHTSAPPGSTTTGSPGSTPAPTTQPTAPASACPAVPAPTPAGNAGAQQDMALTDAWAAAGRGSGVVVAVVDSGVDASVPKLSGRVSVGVDVVTGTESGTTDCLGTGTAMAALIVGDDPEFLLGVAPDATVVPIRVTVDQATATPTNQATAIDVAVSSGAKVIALGSYVDVSLPGVRQAINNAARHDVVVVTAAPAPDDGSLPPQLLRVGMLNGDGRLAREYPPGTVDIVAPGQNLVSLGTGRRGKIQVSGVQYAVALVAGGVALVRGKSPGLPAAEVVKQFRTTATPVDAGSSGPSGPAGDDGLVVVNLTKAVAAAIPSSAARVTPPRASEEDGSGTATILISAAVLLVLVLGGVLLLRRRALRTVDWDPAEPSTQEEWPDSR